MEEVGLRAYEKILCGNQANGKRFETYAIPGPRGSGQIVLNGATAHLGQPGDRLTIMNFAMADEAEAKTFQPRIIVLGAKNQVLSKRGV